MATLRTEEHQAINEFVQSGKRTVKQLVDFMGSKYLAPWIGDRVNRGFWAIQGAAPNGGGCDETEKNRQLGEEIINKHSASEIIIMKQSVTG